MDGEGEPTGSVVPGVPTGTEGAIVGDTLGRGVPLAGRLAPEPCDADPMPDGPESNATAATPKPMRASAATDKPATFGRLGFMDSQLRLRRIDSSLAG